jgi:hypothetical protein
VASPQFTALLAEFLREHHGIEVEFRPKFRGSFSVYRCRTVGSV